VPRPVPVPAPEVSPTPLACRFALFASLLLAALLALRQVDSLDVGFHLRAGNHMLDGQGWPRTDPFTFTLREHDYVDTSWGYQVLIAAVERANGPAGLVLLHAALVVATFALLARTARLGPADPTLLAALLLLGTLACEMRFAVRPELLSYLMLAGVIHLLQRHAEGERAPLPLLPLAFLLWANCHSLFVLGWAALGCFLVGSFLRSFELDRRLALWSLASLVAPLVNPYGLRGVIFPFTLLSRFDASNPFQQEIGEFVSPFDFQALDAQPFHPALAVWSFRVFVALGTLALIGLLRKKRFAEALLVLVFAWPSVRMLRNTPILVVAALPALSAGLVWPARIARFRTVLPVLVAVFAVLLALRVKSNAYTIDDRREHRTGLGWNESVLPVEAAEFVARAQLEGPMLNHLNFGGWLMWALDRPVFIDGRLEVVGEEFFLEYRRALDSQEALQTCVERWGIRWMIFPYATFPRLLGRMSADSRWTLVHADPVGVVFVRAAPGVAPPTDPALASVLAPEPVRLEGLPGLDAGPPRPTRFQRWIEGFHSPQRFPSREHTSLSSTSTAARPTRPPHASPPPSARATAATSSSTTTSAQPCSAPSAGRMPRTATASCSRRSPPTRSRASAWPRSNRERARWTVNPAYRDRVDASVSGRPCSLHRGAAEIVKSYLSLHGTASSGSGGEWTPRRSP